MYFLADGDVAESASEMQISEPLCIARRCDSGVRSEGRLFDCGAFGHKGECVMERVDPLFKVEDAHVQEVPLSLVQASAIETSRPAMRSCGSLDMASVYPSYSPRNHAEWDLSHA